jgi:hypothetical protein
VGTSNLESTLQGQSDSSTRSILMTAVHTRALRPAHTVWLLIVATTIVRVVFASSLGLGIDESYAVATGREPQLSYFDHPPLAWWLAWAGAHLFGTEAPLAVRLPFIAVFALTTWLMFCLTRLLFDERAGLWAASSLNLAPALAWTSGSWVLRSMRPCSRVPIARRRQSFLSVPQPRLGGSRLELAPAWRCYRSCTAYFSSLGSHCSWPPAASIAIGWSVPDHTRELCWRSSYFFP